MNYKLILRVLGFLAVLEGIIISVSALLSLLYGDNDFYTLVLTGTSSFIFGVIIYLTVRNTKIELGKREGYLVVSFGWIVLSIIGAFPFYLTGAIGNYTDAFFETISGFTTTGASILNDIESLSHGILFWRSIIQWLGGMGIIVLSIAILPILKIGGTQMFVAEVPGLKPDKLHPRIKETAKRLWVIYGLFTLAETVLLRVGGMKWFDAVCHSFTTMATGGYSTKQASIAYYDSPFIHYVIIVFMFLAGTNFSLSYFALRGKIKKIFKNEEFKFYLSFIILFTAIVTFTLLLNSYGGFEKSFRDSLFQVVSILTTTGYVTADYAQWLPFLTIIIFLLMFLGGSAGSTGGGMKIVRVVFVLKNSYLEIKRLIHPNAVIPVRFNNKSVPFSVISNVLAFIVLYILIFVIGTIIMSAAGLDLDSAMGSVAATLGNIGPGIGSVGPVENFAHIPDFGKWFLSFLMLLGRLELFTVLLILTPVFWKN